MADEKITQLVDEKEVITDITVKVKQSSEVDNLGLILHEEDFQDLNIADNISLLLGSNSFFAA